jgi:large subunit ribosomal protein L10
MRMKSEKQILLDEIQGLIAHAGSFVIAQYGKLSANKANEFRKELAKVGANFEVVRKRVFIKAAESTGLNIDIDTIPGHIGIIFTESDPIEATKAVLKYSESNDKVFELKGAKFEGKLISAEQIVEISKLPGKDQMRAEFLGLLEAPMAQTLAVLDAVLSSVVYCLENKSNENKAGE